MKKIIALGLAIMLLLGMLSGCGKADELEMSAVAGAWVTVKADTAEEATALLESIEAYEEELALADVNSLEYVKVACFMENGSYYLGYDVEGTKACVRDFYDRYFNALYEGRSTLNDLYSETFDEMTLEEFLQCFAEIYGRESYAQLLDSLAEGAYDYASLEEPTETGTFHISGQDLMCTVTGTNVEEALGAAVAEGVLTLTYADGVEVYTKK